MNKQSIIQVNKLTKVFRSHHITDISFTVSKGECFALCGENGTGKSTIIKMLIGMLKPSSGEILFNGQRVDIDQNYKKLFSFMPDHLLFPGMLTGYETLSFFAQLRGISQERVNEILKAVGLYEERHKKIAYYSKGMQQRLSLAQALLPESPILILDEPTNGLDPYWVYRFKEMMIEEKQKGTTILFSTHVLSLVEELADQVAFVHRGALLLCDSVARIQQSYPSLEEAFFRHYQPS
ncbi:ABC transporter ATP-binding protein [Anoxybacteroides rupiense]|uniref:ABC transporter ATP-binding protein n=1 Tax=Anoxybacteroides rupiense TaxID=311460 RepID=UPI00201368EB|nr:ABC transporter ATP-binding protein [Anoxybacillus rupiensis]